MNAQSPGKPDTGVVGNNPVPRVLVPTERWRPADRLRTTKDFKTGLRRRSRRTAHFTFYVARGRTGRSRLGLIVGRKVGKSVARNRLRRRLREAFRRCRHQFPIPVDLIVRAHPGSAGVSYAQCVRELREAVILQPPRGVESADRAIARDKQATHSDGTADETQP